MLDEPTTGLHFEDIRKLLLVLGRLVDQGNTVLVIEHNLDVIKTADWIVDMGPEGGNRGGLVVAEGTPEEVAANPDSHTGAFLRAAARGPAARAREEGARSAGLRAEPGRQRSAPGPTARPRSAGLASRTTRLECEPNTRLVSSRRLRTPVLSKTAAGAAARCTPR